MYVSVPPQSWDFPTTYRDKRQVWFRGHLLGMVKIPTDLLVRPTYGVQGPDAISSPTAKDPALWPL